MNKQLILTLAIASASTLNAQVIFQDTFESIAGGNNQDINLDITGVGATRQTGGSTTSTYTMTGANVLGQLSTNDDNVTNNGSTTGNGMGRIRNNEQNVGGTATNGFLSLDTNFGTQLAGNKYTVSYDLYYNDRTTSTGDQWISFVATDTSPGGSPVAGASDFGMLARPDGPSNANSGKASFYDEGVQDQAFTDTADYSASYKTFLFTFDEVAGTVSLDVDGSSIASALLIDFDTTDRYFAFGSHLGLDADANAGAEFADSFIDNLTITVVPEPSAYALIGGLLALSWVMVRRRK
jgi:hypothetical protein